MTKYFKIWKKLKDQIGKIYRNGDHYQILKVQRTKKNTNSKYIILDKESTIMESLLWSKPNWEDPKLQRCRTYLLHNTFLLSKK